MTLFAPRALAGLALALLAGTAQAGPSVDVLAALPAVRQAGGVDYITGGIGRDEVAAMRAASASWALALELFRDVGGRPAFTTGVKFSLVGGQGTPVLQATSDGPFFFAQLPPGRYTVFATLGRETLEREVEVVAGQTSRLQLRWSAAAAAR